MAEGARRRASTGGTPDVLVRLRRETRTEHERLEAMLGFASERMSLGSYRRRLEQLLGFYAPLEDGILAVGGWAERGIDLPARLKAPLLVADLRALGEAAPERLPRCPPLDALADPADAFGALYVLEGATLGGQIIRRRLRETLDLTPDSGGRFFEGYGERTAEMWRSFRAALAAFAAPRPTADRVVASAVQTFVRLGRWCGSGG